MRAAGGENVDSFDETVGPIIEEYEKVVSSLNEQLTEVQMSRVSRVRSMNRRGVLTLVQDAIDQMRVDLEVSLQEALDRQAQSEGYVLELRARVAKLSERESSQEVSCICAITFANSVQAYIRDLEGKLRVFADKDETHSDTVQELKKEIAKLKDVESTSNTYINELEGRLSKVDAQSTAFSQKIESYEKEIDRREGLYRDLEARVALLDTSADAKLLLKELDEKHQRVAELERELDEINQGKQNVGAENERLRKDFEAERSIQHELRNRLAGLTPVKDHSGSKSADVTTSNTLSNRLEPTPETNDEIVRLQTAHDATVAELKTVSVKYREALAEITDLASQLSEARLVQSEVHDTVPVSPGPPSEAATGNDDSSENGTTLQTPIDGQSPQVTPTRRKGHRDSLPILSSPGSGFNAVKAGFRQGRGLSDKRNRCVSR